MPGDRLGTPTLLNTGVKEVLAIRYDWRGTTVIVVHNFDENPHDIRLKSGVEGGGRLFNLLVEDESRADGKGVHRVVLEPRGYRWYRVGGLNYALHRTTD